MRLQLADWEKLADGIAAEAQLLLGRVREQLQAAERAETTPGAGFRRHVVERELAAIDRQFARALIALIHPTDERYAAAVSLLRTIGAEEPGNEVSAALLEEAPKPGSRRRRAA